MEKEDVSTSCSKPHGFYQFLFSPVKSVSQIALVEGCPSNCLKAK